MELDISQIKCTRLGNPGHDLSSVFISVPFVTSKRDEYYMCLGVWLKELFQDEKGCFEITLEKERFGHELLWRISCFEVLGFVLQ